MAAQLIRQVLEPSTHRRFYMRNKTKTVNVDQATYRAFTGFVQAKHGKLRGVLQTEASHALRVAAKAGGKP